MDWSADAMNVLFVGRTFMFVKTVSILIQKPIMNATNPRQIESLKKNVLIFAITLPLGLGLQVGQKALMI